MVKLLKPTFHRSLVALLAIATCSSAAIGQSLEGSIVSVKVDYPTFGATKNNPPSRIVGPGTEFLAGSLQPLPGWVIGPVVIDVGAQTITLTWAGTATSGNEAFDGLQFVFDDASPRITGVALDPSSSFTASQIGIGYSDHLAWVNLTGGLTFTPDKIVQLDLTLAPVPEPASSLLLLCGVALLTATRYRSRSKADA